MVRMITNIVLDNDMSKLVIHISNLITDIDISVGVTIVCYPFNKKNYFKQIEKLPLLSPQGRSI